MYTQAFMELDYEAAWEAVRMLIRGSSRFPAISDVRELYVPLRKRQADELARNRGLAEPDRHPPTPEALAALRRLAEAWDAPALAAFADRVEGG